MAQLRPMPAVNIDPSDLVPFGQRWTALGGRLSRTPPQSSAQLGSLLNRAVGDALATMLGGIPILAPSGNALTPPEADCVEVGAVRIIGGVRPQNFDVGYRPDGVRFAFDSKTLNDTKSIKKNWQNMVNDLATEATNVHSRFPYAIVAFMIALPTPCAGEAQRTVAAIIETLERLAGRADVADPGYRAEANTLVLWDPTSGTIDPDVPRPQSALRIEKCSDQINEAYWGRYKGLPPHTA